VPTTSSRSSPSLYLVGITLKGLLYNVGFMDVRALLGVALVLLPSALIAGYVPAGRATRIDPPSAAVQLFMQLFQLRPRILLNANRRRGT
jgi:hypothetical protein